MTALEKVANVCVIVAAVAVTGGTVYDRFLGPKLAASQPGAALARRLANREFSLPVGYRGGTTATLVLFASKSCHFCTESMPFYRRLASLRAAASPYFGMVAIVPSAREKSAEGAAYFQQYEVSLDQVEAMDFSAFGVVSTPTLLLLDGNHRERQVWVGRLSTENEAAVLEKLRQLCRKCITD